MVKQVLQAIPRGKMPISWRSVIVEITSIILMARAVRFTGNLMLLRFSDEWEKMKVNYVFLFGTQTSIYQMTLRGVVGGALGRNTLLIFQIFSEIPLFHV